MSKIDNSNFHFEYTYLDQKLDPKKASQVNDIPIEVIKENKDIVAFSYIITSSSTFPTALKYVDDKTDKENYRG